MLPAAGDAAGTGTSTTTVLTGGGVGTVTAGGGVLTATATSVSSLVSVSLSASKALRPRPNPFFLLFALLIYLFRQSVLVKYFVSQGKVAYGTFTLGIVHNGRQAKAW